MEHQPYGEPTEQHKERAAVQVVLKIIPDQVGLFKKIYGGKLHPVIDITNVCLQIQARLKIAIRQHRDRMSLAPIANKHMTKSYQDKGYFLHSSDIDEVVGAVIGEFAADFQNLVQQLISGSPIMQPVERHHENGDIDQYLFNARSQLRGNSFVIGSILSIDHISHNGTATERNGYGAYPAVSLEQAQAILGVTRGDIYPIVQQTRIIDSDTIKIGRNIIGPFDA